MIYTDKGLRGEPGFAGVCLEYSLFSWGNSEEETIQELDRMIQSYIGDLNECKTGPEQLYRELGDVSMGHFWALFRQLSCLLGESEHHEVREPENRMDLSRVNKELLDQKYIERIEG